MELAQGVLVWDVLSRHDAGMESLRVTAPTTKGYAAARARFSRAHPVLVSCIAAVKAAQQEATVVVHRWYETRSVALNREWRAGQCFPRWYGCRACPGAQQHTWCHLALSRRCSRRLLGRCACSARTWSWSRLGRADPSCAAVTAGTWCPARLARLAPGWIRNSRTCRL